jgi:hypothetical protein
MSAGPRNPSVAQLYRDFADRWEIEPVPPGTRWIGVLREMDGGDVTVVLGRDIGGLRFGMTGVERENPEEREPRTRP